MEPTMNDLLKTFAKINAEIKVLEREKDRLKTDILILMKLDNIEFFETDTHSVRYSMQKRKVVDKRLLEAFLVSKNSNYEAFQKINEYEMIKVIDKTIKQGDDSDE